MEKHKILEKVRKLLDTSVENGATAEESQSAVAMAQKLLAKHNLAMRDVHAFGHGAGSVEVLMETVLSASRINWWEKAMARLVVDNFRCDVLVHKQNGQRVLMFVGEPADIAVAERVLEYALAQMVHHAKVYRKKRLAEYKEIFGTGNGYDGNGVRNDFMHGYMTGLQAKLKEQVEANEELGLMVVKPDAVIKKVQEVAGGHESVRPRSRGDERAREEGYKHGKRFEAPVGSIEG